MRATVSDAVLHTSRIFGVPLLGVQIMRGGEGRGRESERGRKKVNKKDTQKDRKRER